MVYGLSAECVNLNDRPNGPLLLRLHHIAYGRTRVIIISITRSQLDPVQRSNCHEPREHEPQMRSRCARGDRYNKGMQNNGIWQDKMKIDNHRFNHLFLARMHIKHIFWHQFLNDWEYKLANSNIYYWYWL